MILLKYSLQFHFILKKVFYYFIELLLKWLLAYFYVRDKRRETRTEMFDKYQVEQFRW